MAVRSERGVGKLTILVFGTLIGVVVYVGFQIIPFFYYHYELRNQIASTSRVASDLTDQEIRKKITQRMKELEIPADPEALIINRYEDKIRVILEYEEEFYITYKGKDRTIKVFPFKIDMITDY